MVFAGLKRFFTHRRVDTITRTLLVLVIIAAGTYVYWSRRALSEQQEKAFAQIQAAKAELVEISEELDTLKNEDPYKTNSELQVQISSIEEAYGEASEVFDQRADMEQMGYSTAEVDEKLAEMLGYLSNREYENTEGLAKELQTLMNTQVSEAVAKANPVSKVSISNDLPGVGYSRQTVETERGSFTIAMVVASGARVIVDTAGDSDCSNDCPTLPLTDYVSRNGGFAGINGGYFCPPDYASCQGKVNTFDTLVFNGRTKTAFNQGNNVYSTVPLMAAYGSSLNFYSRTLDWGIDSAATGAVANYPLMLDGNNIVFSEDSLPSHLKDVKGTRGFIGAKGGNTVIGHVFAASVMDAAYVLKTLGVERALNLDGGGSSALWSGGYKVGPGRTLPVAIVLVQ